MNRQLSLVRWLLLVCSASLLGLGIGHGVQGAWIESIPEVIFAIIALLAVGM